jgi:exodeoxyribonuclease VII small subunit
MTTESADQPLPTSYEAAFTELQQLVRDLQDESVGPDDLTARLARAGELIRFCRERLRQTEEQVGKLAEAGKI